MKKLLDKIDKKQKETWKIIKNVDFDSIESIKDEATSIGIEIKESHYMKIFTQAKKDFKTMLYKDFKEEEKSLQRYLELLKYEKAFYSRLAKKQLEKS